MVLILVGVELTVRSKNGMSFLRGSKVDSATVVVLHAAKLCYSVSDCDSVSSGS